MVLFLGGKSTGKSSMVNYLLGIDETPWEIKVGKRQKHLHSFFCHSFFVNLNCSISSFATPFSPQEPLQVASSPFSRTETTTPD